jgi:hypothetical protein
MATLEIFPACYHMDHRTIPAGATCRFCNSPPYPGPKDAPLTPAETVTVAPPGLTDPPAPTQSNRLPHRPSIRVPDTATAPHPPDFGLAGGQIRRTAFRPKLPKRTQSSTPILADADPPQPEIHYLFAVAVAIGHWPSEDALECRFTPLENKASAEISGNKDIFFHSFLDEFLDAAKGVPIEAAFRYDQGNWRVAMNHKSRQTPLIFLPHWTGRRPINDIMRSWPHRGTVYPVTICWEPSQDQTPSELPWDTFSFRSTSPEAQLVEESAPEPSAATANLVEKSTPEPSAATANLVEKSTPEPSAATANPVEESTPEPSAAIANHKRGISDVTTRSEREQQHGQERPAARHSGRRVGASELEGLGIRGGQEAQGTSERRVTRTRKIRAPRRAAGDELQ